MPQNQRYCSLTVVGRHHFRVFSQNSVTHILDTSWPPNLKFWFLCLLVSMNKYANFQQDWWWSCRVTVLILCGMTLWLNRTTNFTLHDCQNEMLELLSHAVVRSIISIVKAESRQFAVVVDGTQDCAGLEQESICIRYVDKTLSTKCSLGYTTRQTQLGKHCLWLWKICWQGSCCLLKTSGRKRMMALLTWAANSLQRLPGHY